MFGWPKFPIAHVKNSQPKKHYASGFAMHFRKFILSQTYAYLRQVIIERVLKIKAVVYFNQISMDAMQINRRSVNDSLSYLAAI